MSVAAKEVFDNDDLREYILSFFYSPDFAANKGYFFTFICQKGLQHKVPYLQLVGV